MVGNILGRSVFESVLTIWCSSLLEDARAILSVYYLHLAVCSSFETLRFACPYKSLKIVYFVFLSTWHFSLLAIKSTSLIDSSHGQELWVMGFCREGGACLSSTVRKKSQNLFAFSTDEISEALESSAINDGR